jgi:hypothetical protein
MMIGGVYLVSRARRVMGASKRTMVRYLVVEGRAWQADLVHKDVRESAANIYLEGCHTREHIQKIEHPNRCLGAMLASEEAMKED